MIDLGLDGSIIYLLPIVFAKDMPEVSFEDIQEFNIHQRY